MLKQEPKEANLRDMQTASKRNDEDSDDDWVVDFDNSGDKTVMGVMELDESSGDEGFVHV